MRKIPTVFVRDEATNRKHVRNEVTPGCEWVLAGEGRATRKWDGTCVMFDGEDWWARREVKPGKSAPAGFVEVEHDDATGKTVGWEPAGQSGFAKYLAEAIDPDQPPPPGTYELVGPKINGNPESSVLHLLYAHGNLTVRHVPRTFEALREMLTGDFAGEGIVWHHPDGRMAKLKVRDFPASATGPPEARS